MRSIKIVCLVAILGGFLISCASSKRQTENALYFRNISDSLLQLASIDHETIFQKGDILSINVVTPNEASYKLFNPGTGNTSIQGVEGSSPLQPQGYLINEKGDITFPYLGQVKAVGLTRTMLTDTLTRKLQRYIDSSSVIIRLLNYRVTILGEVAKPGAFSIPSERVSILDAIGLAGDLTVYGKRNNIRVIRTIDGNRQTATLDLNKGDIFNSPFFYLRQNDIVYVEMNDRKIPNSDQSNIRQWSMALGIVSALGVIISTINVLK